MTPEILAVAGLIPARGRFSLTQKFVSGLRYTVLVGVPTVPQRAHKAVGYQRHLITIITRYREIIHLHHYGAA